MSFLCPIQQYSRAGLQCLRVDVPLIVFGRHGEMDQEFVFDTGCEITTVSEDVATALGLPSGGRELRLTGVTGGGRCRIVDVRFQFPRTTSGGSGLEVSSTWVVSSAGKGIALLGFMEVHRHFQIKPFEFDVYFIPWPRPRGA
ncbi:MAG: hypothetical protein C0467_01610 [Planctomycetaceae bacterium]|nr:hypothetical protein [Planctomycetaceae bacterium]